MSVSCSVEQVVSGNGMSGMEAVFTSPLPSRPCCLSRLLVVESYKGGRMESPCESSFLDESHVLVVLWELVE